jgi:hypothetical protein
VIVNQCQCRFRGNSSIASIRWSRREFSVHAPKHSGTGHASSSGRSVSSDSTNRPGTVRAETWRNDWSASVYLDLDVILAESIVSTDTLFPEIPEVEHVDPRDIG